MGVGGGSGGGGDKAGSVRRVGAGDRIRGVECGAFKDSGVKEGKVGGKERLMLRKHCRERPKSVSKRRG